MDIYYDEEKEAWCEYKPYATIDVATEEDYKKLQAAMEKENAVEPRYGGLRRTGLGRWVPYMAYCPQCNYEFDPDDDRWMGGLKLKIDCQIMLGSILYMHKMKIRQPTRVFGGRM